MNVKILITFSLLLAIAGCGSTTTTTSGPITYNPVSSATSLGSSITSASVANGDSTGGAPSVTFTVTDQNGNGVTGLALTSMRFTIAKLIEASNGETAHWQSYLNTLATKDAGDPGSAADGSSAVQATSENTGALTDHGDGSYTYVFSHNIGAISTANGEVTDVSYESTLTHRIGLSVSGTGISITGNGTATVVTNATYDFRPSSGSTSGLTTKDVAKTANCNECHSTLAVHGGSRREVKFCVTCHNPGTTDPNSGLVLDFARMVHKIHRGASLPSVASGGETYTIWGYNDSVNDYSTVTFPQEIRHCDKCHDPADTDTPDADNYTLVPTKENCGSCHDDIVFDSSTPASWQTAHPGGTATNADCTSCHGGSGATVDGRIAGVHAVTGELNRAYFQFNMVSIANTDPGDFPAITFSVTNPLDSDSPYDLASATEFNTSGFSSVAIILAWDNDDFNNTDNSTCTSGTCSSTAPASAITLTAVSSSGLSGSVTNNGDGTYSMTSTKAISASATGSGTVAVYGYAAGVDGNGDNVKVTIDAATESFAITDTSATDRREVVDIEKCNSCHYLRTMHGDSRTNSILLCATCHNPNNTDISKRSGTTGTDGLYERSIDFKYMIHAIHAGEDDEHGFRENGVIIYGYGNTAHDYGEMRYPGELKNCLACHKTDTYLLPVASTVLPTTIATAASGVSTGTTSRMGPTDDLNITPTAAVCSACHDSSLAQAHMENNDGIFSDTDANITAADPETCVVCHGDGDVADVKVMHGITD